MGGIDQSHVIDPDEVGFSGFIKCSNSQRVGQGVSAADHRDGIREDLCKTIVIGNRTDYAHLVSLDRTVWNVVERIVDTDAAGCILNGELSIGARSRLNVVPQNKAFDLAIHANGIQLTIGIHAADIGNVISGDGDVVVNDGEDHGADRSDTDAPCYVHHTQGDTFIPFLQLIINDDALDGQDGIACTEIHGQETSCRVHCRNRGSVLRGEPSTRNKGKVQHSGRRCWWIDIDLYGHRSSRLYRILSCRSKIHSRTGRVVGNEIGHAAWLDLIAACVRRGIVVLTSRPPQVEQP